MLRWDIREPKLSYTLKRDTIKLFYGAHGPDWEIENLPATFKNTSFLLLPRVEEWEC